MNESDLRAELQRLASASPASPARLDLDEIKAHGRQRIRRRRAAALPAAVAAAALVVLSSVGILQLASAVLSGSSPASTPATQISEAGAGTNPVNRQWVVPVGQQIILVQGHVAF